MSMVCYTVELSVDQWDLIVIALSRICYYAGDGSGATGHTDMVARKFTGRAASRIIDEIQMQAPETKA